MDLGNLSKIKKGTKVVLVVERDGNLVVPLQKVCRVSQVDRKISKASDDNGVVRIMFHTNTGKVVKMMYDNPYYVSVNPHHIKKAQLDYSANEITRKKRLRELRKKEKIAQPIAEIILDDHSYELTTQLACLFTEDQLRTIGEWIDENRKNHTSNN